jgi:hypothetical protein
MHDRLLLLAAILAWWQQPVASIKALIHFYQAMHVVSYRRTDMAIKIASKVSAFFHRCFVCCCPGGRQGNTERVVAQWRRPVASRIAMNMLHWEMPSVLLQRACMAIKMGRNGGTFDCH